MARATSEEGRLIGTVASHIKALIRNPRDIGAVCPSSRFLASRMAAPVSGDVTARGCVVELGAGTGPVTAALLGRGVPADRLFVVEKMEPLAAQLAARFPSARVLCCSADDLSSRVDGPVAAVVSSLPFRSLPHEVCLSINAEIERLLMPGGIYVQFTYALFGALPFAPQSFEHVGSSCVMLNIPPAKVVVLRKPQK